MTLGEIYDQHADFVWRCLRRQGVVGEDDTADAIQEVFLTVHRSLAGFQGRSSLRTWLFTICRSVVRDRRNRAYRRHEVASLEVLGSELEGRANAASRLEHNARLALLESVLATLEPGLRELFVLYEIEDMTGEEISQALSLPLGTVYARLQVARTAFQREVARRQQVPDSVAVESQQKPRVSRAGGRA